MNIFDYIEGKRYFLMIYAVLMLFVTLMMSVSTETAYLIDNVLYVNVGAMILAAIYILTGYLQQKSFYDDLRTLITSSQGGDFVGVPKPPGYEHRLYMQLLEELNKRHVDELEIVHGERRDHQDFIMSWIHEVKLPITASRMLMRNSNGVSMEYLVDKLEDELNKIDNYVEQALYYSRVDSFSNDYFIAEISLNQVAKETVKKYSKLFISKRIRVVMWDTEQVVYSDSKWLGFVVDQVVANALKYTPEAGTITFIVEDSSKEKLLQIEDTGLGINPGDINRVFEKGFTGSGGRDHSKSTGMGLYLARQMAMKLGHRISIQSEEGIYTKVTIHFPKITNYQCIEPSSAELNI